MYVDRTIYELESGESSIPSITEIERNEITRLVFWCIKYQISSKSIDIIKPIFIVSEKKLGRALQSVD